MNKIKISAIISALILPIIIVSCAAGVGTTPDPNDSSCAIPDAAVNDSTIPDTGTVKDTSVPPDTNVTDVVSTPDTSTPDVVAQDTSSPPPPNPDSGITGLNGETYYVSPTGNDTNPGTFALPWKTIQQAGAKVKAGDTVIVEAGTYAGVIFGWDNVGSGETDQVISGTSTNPILFEADPNATVGSVIINSNNAQTAMGFDLEPGCNYVDIVGFTMTNTGGGITKAGIAVLGNTGNRVMNNTVNGVSGIGGILIDTATNVVVSNNVIEQTKGSGSTGHGAYISGSSTNVQILNNLIHDNQFAGLHVNGDVSEGLPGVVSNVTISGNQIFNNGQNGLNCDGIQKSLIENNVIYNNSRNGIDLYQIDAFGGSIGNVIVNNTIDESKSTGNFAIEVDQCNYDNQSSQPTPANCDGTGDTSTGNIVFNNYIVGQGGSTSVIGSGDLSLGTNILVANTSMFTNPASGDYTLVSGGAGAGTGVASFSGVNAPAVSPGVYDIGAFAFVK